jgi:hypothetical protein
MFDDAGDVLAQIGSRNGVAHMVFKAKSLQVRTLVREDGWVRKAGQRHHITAPTCHGTNSFWP